MRKATSLTPMVGVMMMVVVMTFKGHVTSSTTETASGLEPTVVVMVDPIFVEENRHLPQIFQKINQVSDTTLREVNFDVVIVANKSTALSQACAKLQDGMVAMIDMTSRYVAPLLRSLASSAGLAYISMVDNSYYRHSYGDEEVQWRVEPSSVRMLHVVADIVRKEQLNNVALVYDDSFDIQNTPRRVLTNVPAHHMYMKMSENDTERQVSVLQDVFIKSIFVMANSENTNRFLGQLNKLDSDIFVPELFILTKEATVKCESCKESMRLLVIRGKTSVVERDRFVRYVRDSGIATGFDNSQIKVDEALVYDVALLIRSAMPSTMEPIVYTNCSAIGTAREADRKQSKRLVDTLKNITVHGVFGTLETHQEQAGYDLTLFLSEMFVKNGFISQQTQVGEWTDSMGLNVTASLSTANRRRFYRVVTVAAFPPFVYKHHPTNGTGSPWYDGYCIELLKDLAARMDFDYEIYESPDGQVGSMAEDGSWSGVIKELIDNRADIAVGPISVMAERENVVDFTVPYYDLVGLTILMRKPNFDYSLVKFLSVLDEGVWGCIIGAFFVFSFLICFFDRLSPFSYQNNRNEWNGEGQEPRVFTFKEGIWFCMMSLTPQGGGETPRALSGRLVAATWWLFGFIIIATYTANLAAFLTVRRLETKITSLDDLSKQFKIKYAPMNGSNAQIYFSRMANIEELFYGIWKDMSLSNDMEAVERAKLAVWDYPVNDKYTKLWQTMKNTTFPATKEEAIQQVLTGRFAFIADATVNKYAAYTNCDLWEVGDEFSRKPYALAVQENSPLRAEVSNAILQLINERKLEEMKTEWWEKDRLQCPDIETESDGISIRNIGGVFLVIVIGAALALLMLAMECYWYKYKVTQKKKLYTLSTKQSTAPSTPDDANGLKPGDGSNNFSSNNTSTATSGLQEGFINDGFVEVTERL